MAFKTAGKFKENISIVSRKSAGTLGKIRYKPKVSTGPVSKRLHAIRNSEEKVYHTIFHNRFNIVLFLHSGKKEDFSVAHCYWRRKSGSTMIIPTEEVIGRFRTTMRSKPKQNIHDYKVILCIWGDLNVLKPHKTVPTGIYYCKLNCE